MATYPTAIYPYTNRTGTQTLAAGTHSTIHNEAAAEVVAIETELGTNVKGAYPTVRDRLDGITAAVGTTHTQNTDLGTSSPTFYLNGASGLLLKGGSGVSVRNNTDTLYVDFHCADLLCSSINGISSATLTSIANDSHTHGNKATLDTYTQSEVNLADAVTKKHTQNTDTGSTNETFQLNNVNPLNSAKLKVDDLTPTMVDIRNAADSAFAPIRALEFRGDVTVNNADPNLARIRFNDGTDRWQFSNDGLTFIDFFPAAGSLSILDTASLDLSLSGVGVLSGDVVPGGVDHNALLNYSANRHFLVGGAATHVQYNDGAGGLAGEAAFYYNAGTDTLYVPNVNVSGLIVGVVVAGGTTSDTWEVNSDGNGLTLDTVGLTGDVTILATDLVGVMGTGIQDLTDPGADRIMFWDESSNFVTWLTASTGISITGTNITTNDSQIAHNSLSGYDANRHIDHTGVSISSGTGLTGGGDISASRTISLSHLGIQSLTDPNADRIMFWDDTSGFVDWLQMGTNISITGTTLNVTIPAMALDDLSDVVLVSPTVDHILRYNGTQWVNGPETNVNSGSGVDYFPDTTASDIGGYVSLNKGPQNVAEQDYTAVCNNNTVLIEEFASPVAGIGGTQIDSGVWTFDVWGYTSNAALATNIQIEVYKRTTVPVETLLFTVTSPALTTSLTLHSITSIQQAFAINSDDRLVIKVYGVTLNLVNTTVHYAFGGTTHYSHVNTPLVVRHNDIAGLQGGSGTERYHMTQAQNTALHVAATSGTGIGVAGQVVSLSHLGIQSLTDPGAHRLMAWDDTDGSVQWVTVGSGVTYTQATHTLTSSHTVTGSLVFTFDGGGVAITAGVKGDIRIPFACTINRATMLADQSGSMVVDIWKDTYANYAPTVADTITAAAKPTIAAATKSEDSTLTGWTTSVTADDILRFNVDSCATITRCVLELRYTRTI